MSLLLEQIAEQKIREAEARGEFDNLPGAGRPLVLDDDRDVPESLRVGYRLLKNAGFLPPELHTLREIRDVEDLLANTDIEASERRMLHKRLDVLMMRLERQGRGIAMAVRAQYQAKLSAAVGKNDDSGKL